MFLGRGSAGHCAVTLYVGEGLRGSNGTHSTLHWTSVTLSATHNQTGPLWCWLPSGWACAHPRPLWVSPTTSLVRLGVSPAAPQPPRAFSIRGLRLYFPVLEPWVVWSALFPAICPVYLCVNVGPGVLPTTLTAPFSATLSPALSVYLCANMGPQGLLMVRPPALFVPYSASLGPSTATRVLSAPAAYLRPSYWSG